MNIYDLPYIDFNHLKQACLIQDKSYFIMEKEVKLFFHKIDLKDFKKFYCVIGRDFSFQEAQINNYLKNSLPWKSLDFKEELFEEIQKIEKSQERFCFFIEDFSLFWNKLSLVDQLNFRKFLLTQNGLNLNYILATSPLNETKPVWLKYFSLLREK